MESRGNQIQLIDEVRFGYDDYSDCSRLVLPNLDMIDHFKSRMVSTENQCGEGYAGTVGAFNKVPNPAFRHLEPA
jgi:hypothetical protein